MENLPLDTSHPAVRDYIALVRLQVLTPLSLLINIAVVVVCASCPTRGVAKFNPTSISPKPAVIAAYVAVIYIAQVGYCVLLVLASKPETKLAMLKGVGIYLVSANWVMAAWAIAWVFQWFLLSTILQGLLVLLLLYSNIALLVYHPPTSERPLDTALIHFPLRFFLVLPLSILFPYSLFISLGLNYTPTPTGPPLRYDQWHAWAGFGAVFATNVFGAAVVLLRRDVVWAAAATWVCVSIWSQRPKPNPVYITAILFTALHPLILVLATLHARFYKRPARPVVLPGDDAAHPGLYPREGQAQEGPREVDVEGTWGR
ncbi:hypothetical protein BD779DRAFT_1508162 [Infundibulicybe gibba]|nr:hypothetical protein BD779DRAFT_1508162 [Infundibulicybe gibba]